METIEEKFRAPNSANCARPSMNWRNWWAEVRGRTQDMRAMIDRLNVDIADLQPRLDKPAKPRLVGGRDTKKDVCHG